MAFKNTATNGVKMHTGDPHCDAAHATLLQGLKALGTNFIGPTETISNSQKGNLGEFITFQIARGVFGPHKKYAGNALAPLSRISGAGLDLTYVYLDPTSALNDLIFIQEIKTTGAGNLSYLDQLVPDYKKLFSTDLNLTLQSRLQFLQNKLEYEEGDPAAALRVANLGATTPQACSRVKLVPTGISSMNVGAPESKMLSVKASISAFGWSSTNIEPWHIALSDLEDRLLRLARGQS